MCWNKLLSFCAAVSGDSFGNAWGCLAPFMNAIVVTFLPLAKLSCLKSTGKLAKNSFKINLEKVNSFYILSSLPAPIMCFIFQLSWLFFFCVAQSTSEAKHNLYCQDRSYKMKLNMADVERVVCLQMITCHNMFFWFVFFFSETLD